MQTYTRNFKKYFTENNAILFSGAEERGGSGGGGVQRMYIVGRASTSAYVLVLLPLCYFLRRGLGIRIVMLSFHVYFML